VHIKSASSQQHDAQGALGALLQSTKVDNGGAALETKVRILNADILEGIRDTAIEEKADLLIVGRGHETGNLSRMWSHLYTIIRESPCPVLSV
jgi:nucleotide-binding universal stress UspA family protein